MNIIIILLLKIIFVVCIIICSYYFMCSHKYFLRSVKNNNLVTLSENIFSSTQIHLQTQNADTIPVHLLFYLQLVLKSLLHLYHHLILSNYNSSKFSTIPI